MRPVARSKKQCRCTLLSLLATSSILFQLGPVKNDSSCYEGTDRPRRVRKLTVQISSFEIDCIFHNISMSVDVKERIPDPECLYQYFLGGKWKAGSDSDYTQLLDDYLTSDEVVSTFAHIHEKIGSLHLFARYETETEGHVHTLSDTLGSYYLHPATHHDWLALLRTLMTESRIHQYAHRLPRLLAHTLTHGSLDFHDAFATAMKLAIGSASTNIESSPASDTEARLLMELITERAPIGGHPQARSVYDFLKPIQPRLRAADSQLYQTPAAA